MPLLPTSLLLLLGSFYAQGVLSVPGNHSLTYFTTAVVGAEFDTPYFFAVMYLNDILLEWFDSHVQVLEPRALWIKKAVGPNYWRERTPFLRFLQYNSVIVLLNIMKQTKQMEGVHTYQTMESCEVTEHNTTFMFFKTAFDGEDFLNFNTDTMNWTAARPEAEATARTRNANKTLSAQFLKGLHMICEDTKYLLPFANQTLQRKDKPHVRVTERRVTNDSMTLSCHSNGFYPRRIEVKWLKNRVKTEVELEPEEILLNPDGTYHAIVSLDVTSGTRDDYSCLVRHSSLEEDTIVQWERGLEPPPAPGKDMDTAQRGLPIGGIIGVTLALVLLVVVMTLGLVNWQKRRRAEDFGEMFSNA